MAEPSGTVDSPVWMAAALHADSINRSAGRAARGGEKLFHETLHMMFCQMDGERPGKACQTCSAAGYLHQKMKKTMDKNGGICEREKIKIHFTEMLDD